MVQASISQSNVLGTGNLFSVQLSSGAVDKIYSFTYVNQIGRASCRERV